VRVPERPADLDGDERRDLGEPDGPRAEELLQRLPVDELGDDVRARRAGPRVVEDFEDVLVPQLRHRLRLALEAGLGFRLSREVLVQNFDGNLTLQRLVLRAIDDRHTTLAHLFDESIAIGNPGLLHPSP